MYEEYRSDAQRSIDKYGDVKDIAPNYVQVHHQTGLVYMKLGDTALNRNDQAQATYYYNIALENFEKYRRIDPIFLQNYLRMAYVYMKMGNWQKAEETYRAHLDSANICHRGEHNVLWEDWGTRRKPEYGESAVNLGNVLYYQKRITESEAAYKLSLQFNPGNTQAWRNLAILYGNLQRAQDALNCWRKILELNPNDQDARRILGQITGSGQ